MFVVVCYFYNLKDITAGVFKLLTLGGCGIWAMVDWIRILCDTFEDGRGLPLYDDM